MSQSPRGEASGDPRLAMALSTYEREGAASLERLCDEYPDLADEIRRSVSLLDVLGRAMPESAPEREFAFAEGSLISRYRIKALVGIGGMGRVFRARDPDLERDVAIKILTLPFASSDQALGRIRKEARLLAQVRHDHIVRVHESGVTREGLPFFVMDLVDGVPLSAILTRLGGRDPARLSAADLGWRQAGNLESTNREGSYAEAVVRLLLPIADALAAAHQVGVIHRDVKPGNILVEPGGRAHLVDFGLAREADSLTLTASGHPAGTPSYMAPEQVSATSSGVSPATDVYGLGVTLYESLTLRKPFDGQSLANVYWSILNEEPRRPSAINSAIAADLETICLAAMEKRAVDRYARAGELANDLRALLELRPVSRRPLRWPARLARQVRRRPWPVTAILAVVLAVAAVFYARQASRQSQIDTQAIAHRIEDGYETLGSPPVDWDRFGELVAELSVLAPLQNEVLDFNDVLRDHAITEAAARHEASANAALEEASTLFAAAASRHDPRIDELCHQATTAINAMSSLRPERDGLDSLLERVYSLRRRWLQATGSAPGAEAGGLAPSNDGQADLFVEGTPAGASAFLFRYQRQSSVVAGGEACLVPVPVRARRMAQSNAQDRAWVVEPVTTPVPPGADVFLVESVDADSAAWRAGARPGDLVVEVAGRPLDRRAMVLPADSRADDPLPDIDAVVVPAFTPVSRLHDRVDPQAFDLELIRATTPEGAALSATLELAPQASASRQLAISVRRTPHGFAPPLGTVGDALQRPPPPDGVELVLARGSSRITIRIAGPGPTGIGLAATSYPLSVSDENLVGVLPLEMRGLPPDSYLLVLRADAREDLRLPVRLEPGRTLSLRSDLLPDGTTPPGFVYVPPGPYVAGATGREDAWPLQEHWIDGYWIGRTEVTVAEYLEFLNDSGTLAAISEGERTRTLIRVPRVAIIDRRSQPTCRVASGWRKVDGRYVTDTDPLRPAMDISCEDADEYCRWLTARSEGRWIYRLPTEDEWEKAARGVDGRLCPWGDVSQPAYWKSESAHALSGMSDASYKDLVFEPVTRFTRDESPFGVRDTAGNVLEWCVGAPHRNIPFRRPWRGGQARPENKTVPECSQRSDGYPDRPGGNDGFRVVAWPTSRPR